MTVVFGLVHLPAYIAKGCNRWSWFLAITLAAVMGMLLGLIYLRTGSLWLPVGIHFAWNFVENDLLNLTGDATNANLIARWHGFKGHSYRRAQATKNAIVLDWAAFVILSILVWLWMVRRPVLSET